jgi:hypothetical protein
MFPDLPSKGLALKALPWAATAFAWFSFVSFVAWVSSARDGTGSAGSSNSNSNNTSNNANNANNANNSNDGNNSNNGNNGNNGNNNNNSDARLRSNDNNSNTNGANSNNNGYSKPEGKHHGLWGWMTIIFAVVSAGCYGGNWYLKGLYRTEYNGWVEKLPQETADLLRKMDATDARPS